MLFAWDPDNARSNERKHGVAFEEAVTCFLDEHGRLFEDGAHHHRFALIAVSNRHRLIFRVHAEIEHEPIRIISARLAAKPERRRYEEEEGP